MITVKRDVLQRQNCTFGSFPVLLSTTAAVSALIFKAFLFREYS